MEHNRLKPKTNYDHNYAGIISLGLHMHKDQSIAFTFIYFSFWQYFLTCYAQGFSVSFTSIFVQS